MKWIPKYQKAGKLNFKTTGLPWQQSGVGLGNNQKRSIYGNS